MKSVEQDSWVCLKNVTEKFLVNYRDSNYATIVEKRFQNFQKISSNVSLKIRFLHSHLDYFPEILSKMSKGQNEKSQKDMECMENAINDTGMFSDY